MGYSRQSGSRGHAGVKTRKASRSKTKPKPQKKPSNIKYAPAGAPLPSAQDLAEKTLSSLSRLGSQTFALSPFSQYFDDWYVDLMRRQIDRAKLRVVEGELRDGPAGAVTGNALTTRLHLKRLNKKAQNLQQVISEVESTPTITVDEAFVTERKQIFLDIEGELAKIRLKETELDAYAQTLAETNHLLVDLDAEYAAQTRELAAKRNSGIERLTKSVHDIEEELSRLEQLKTSFFDLTKRAKKKKQEDATQRLTAAKSELEVVVQNFAVEQDKLHDEYAKKKQVTMEKVQSLEAEVAHIETDQSLEARQKASDALANAVKTLLQRQTETEPFE
jgi:hypothetical protein